MPHVKPLTLLMALFGLFSFHCTSLSSLFLWFPLLEVYPTVYHISGRPTLLLQLDLSTLCGEVFGRVFELVPLSETAVRCPPPLLLIQSNVLNSCLHLLLPRLFPCPGPQLDSNIEYPLEWLPDCRALHFRWHRRNLLLESSLFRHPPVSCQTR